MGTSVAAPNVEALFGELRRRAESMPYRVERTAQGATVGLDIADLRYVTLWYRRRLALAYTVALVFDESRLTYYREQSSQEIRYAIGTGGEVLGAELEKSRTRGTVHEMQRGVVGGIHDDGDLFKGYSFDSREITRFVDGVMVESGWRRRMDPHTRWGLAGAVAGGTVALLAGGFAAVAAIVFGGR
ncbi:hypothetical protein [Microbacterium sp.]|uniref:hypothetical protein n=1 Tax=Microbacterium sp. TaxID=51671 RepID=UPI00333F39C1